MAVGPAGGDAQKVASNRSRVFLWKRDEGIQTPFMIHLTTSHVQEKDKEKNPKEGRGWKGGKGWVGEGCKNFVDNPTNLSIISEGRGDHSKLEADLVYAAGISRKK